MSTVPKLVTVIAIAALLAGCVADPGVEKVQSEDGAPAAASSTTAPAANAAPVAVLSALIDGASATITDGTLTIPAGTSVVFSSAGSSDPDADTVLSYAWTLDDASAGTDATFTQAFAAADTHAVQLTVSDGELEAVQDLDVVVEAAAPAIPVATGGGAVTYLITGALPDPVLHEPLATGEPIIEGTVVEHPFDVPAGATRLTAYLTWADPLTQPLVTDLDLYLLDAAGVEQGSAAVFTVFELAEITDAAKLPAGTWTAQVSPFTVPPEVVEYTLQIIVWTGVPTATEFAESHAAAINVGEDTPAETAPDVHAFTVPDGASAIAARLTWEIPGVVDCTDRDPGIDYIPLSVPATAANDFDFYVYNAAGAEVFHSGGATTCEFGISSAALAPGAYTVEVVPFAVAAADYALTVWVA